MKEIARLVLILTAICVVAALALAQVYELTKEPIARQKRLEVLKAIRAVLPNIDNEPDIVKSREGYGGNIEIMLGVDPQGVILGVEILSHLETPGLGSKISEEAFRQQFAGRRLEDTRWAVRKDGGDIDQITGATVSPRAVVDAIHQGLEFFQKNQTKILEG